MPRWVSPTTIKKLFVQNDDPERLSAFMSSVLLPVSFQLNPAERRFHHQAEIGIIGDLFIWNSYSETGYLAEWHALSSDRMELHFVDAGESRSTTNSQQLCSGAGHVYLLYDTRGHRLAVSPGTRQTCISVPFEHYAKLVSTTERDPVQFLRDFVPVLQASHPAARVIRDIANILHAEGQKDNPFVSLTLPAAILKEALLQALIASWPQREADVAYRPVPRYIRRATEWIEEHLAEKIFLEDIARAAGTSARTLQAFFREQTGMSPMQYITKLRLRYVHNDLLDVDNDKTIAEIAKARGFRHVGDFERYYNKRYGQTPSETRRQAKFQI